MRISCQNDIDEGIDFLISNDGKLSAIMNNCGPIPLRLSEPSFAGLASIVVSQQVSKASADAIYGRLKRLVDPLSPKGFLQAGESVWKEAGLSRPKQRTLTAVSEAVINGHLDLDGLCSMEPEQAMENLVSIKGIGPWSAEIYLMFCAGHRDIFPAGDLALQEAIRMGFDLKKRPDEKKCRKLAKKWSPWRAVAARLLWDYYRVMRKDASPV